MSERTASYLRELTATITDIAPLLEIYEEFDYLTHRQIKGLYLGTLLYQNDFKYDAIAFLKTILDKDMSHKAIDILLSHTLAKGIIESE